MKILKFKHLIGLLAIAFVLITIISCTTEDTSAEEQLYQENSHDWNRNERN